MTAKGCHICKRRATLLLPFVDAKGVRNWALICPNCDRKDLFPRYANNRAA